ncbi:MFS transporter [Roseomonas sp. ACRSG]|nr:MFS transporter [Roseomonas sp. ACRSG]
MTFSPSPDTARDGAGVMSPARVRLVILALAMGGFAIGIGEFAVMSLMPNIAGNMDVSLPQGSHMISAYALGVVVGAPVIAVLAARLPRHLLLIGLMLLYALGHLASATAGGFNWLVGFRFVSGLPHGAYFGIASLVAASLAPPDRRARAVAMVMLGLTLATLAGVPLANWMGQFLGWRASFGLVGALALLTAVLLALFAPRGGGVASATSPLQELGALRKPQVLLTIATGAVGFGGMFAVYTYLEPTLVQVAGAPASVLPLMLMVFGLGMVVGNIAGGWMADRALMPAIAGILLWIFLACLLVLVTAGNVWALGLNVFLVGCGVALGAGLQTRLMDVAQEAQTLAAAMNHSALNIANALGPWLGGLAIAAGYGWTSTGWVGALLSAAGLAIFLCSWALERRKVAQLSFEPAERSLQHH